MTLARWLSIVFHPFVMVAAMVGAAAAARQSHADALRSVAVVVLFTIVPLAFLMWRQVRRGTWDNADASNRTETLGMLAVCAMATPWIKVSLHMAFATLAATALALVRSPIGDVLLLALPPLVWARLTLQRHTLVEVALGTVIGAAAGIALHYL